MTAEELPGEPAAQQPAYTEASPPADRLPVPDVIVDAAGTTPRAEGEPEPPADPQQLKEEIERTREQLGETVEQLAAKADLKGRSRTKAAQLAGRAKSTTLRARGQAAAGVASMRVRLAGTAAVGRHRAVSAGRAGTGQLQCRAAAVAAPVRQATPEPVRRAAARGTTAARQRPVPLAVAGAAVVLVYMVARQWRKR
jgi:Protein of unknown function (DUF3618)